MLSRKLVLSAAILLFGCSGTVYSGQAPVQVVAPSADRCAMLTQLDGKALSNPTAAVASAKYNEQTAGQPNPETGGAAGAVLPQHCEVIGSIDQRVGANGQKYAIRFHLRLPTAWNGRFYYQAGGG